MKVCKKQVLHGQYEKMTTDVRYSGLEEWQKKDTAKKRRRGILMAAQDQALETNSIKSSIDKQDASPVCRMH